MTTTVDTSVEQQARAAWRRITAAVEAGAPVPFSIHIHGGANISYAAPVSTDPLADAAAMARLLGLTVGPIGRPETVRWENTTDDWATTGHSWSVWAHLPKADVNEQEAAS